MQCSDERKCKVTVLQERIFIIIIACVLDLIFGDPHWLWHPVQGMGWLIDHVEAWMRKRFRIREERDTDIRKKQVAGTGKPLPDIPWKPRQPFSGSSPILLHPIDHRSNYHGCTYNQ